MAQLEKLKKADLVKLARELKQDNKLLKKELENVQSGELDDSKLPLYAHTYYKDGDKHVVDVMKYSPESNNVKVIEKIVENTKELALFKLEMVIVDKFHQQVYERSNNE
jgi:hypothetical protein